MPNHILNHLTIEASLETLDAILKEFGTEVPASLKKTYDNESFICTHKDGRFCWLDIRTGRCHDRGELNQIGLPEGFEPSIQDSFLLFPDFRKVIIPPNDPAYRDEPSQDIARHSPNWWYNWNVEHWGTKWNAYSCKKKDINVYTFETAWSPVPKIIETISYKYTDAVLKYKWSDEDTGSNCGYCVYKNGLIEEFIPTNGSIQAFDLAFELRPHYKEDYELVDGKYQYKED